MGIFDRSGPVMVIEDGRAARMDRGALGWERWGRRVLGLLVLGCWGAAAEDSIKVERHGTELRLRTPDMGGGVLVLEESEDLGAWKPVYAFPAGGEPGGIRIVPAANGLRTYRLQEGSWRPGENWVWVPAGEFVMGSPMYESGRNGDEGPQRVVAIRRGFWMARHETTQVEFLDLMGFNPSYMPFDASRPVEMVTFDQAESYCAALTSQARARGTLPPGCRYRLPSEAEWEYACRAGTSTRYSYGDDADYTLLDEYGWAGVNAGQLTHPVESLRPNPWGLYDMHGNVFEWCLDYYGPYPGGEREGYEKGRVYRGGSWYCPSDVLRSASRHPGTQLRSYFIGFRVVLGAEPDTVLPLLEVDPVKPVLEWAEDGTSVRVRGECATEESWVVYTTNGWIPYATGMREPPVVTKALTVRIMAFRQNYTQSAMATVVVEQVGTPQIEVSGTSMTVLARDAGATIEYRWDGEAWMPYGGPVNLPAGPGEVEARARKSGRLTSAVARRSF